MTGITWLFRVTFPFVSVIISAIAIGEVRGDENASDAIRSLQEQVTALLDHRQQDYNALEESLKRAMEKNTELFVLKNEVKQLRKEVDALRGGNASGNEAKNERLRVRWLGSAVTELQGEVADVLRARNISEELAERFSMKGELTLLKGDIAAVGRGIRNLGGRIAKHEAMLGTIRVDISAIGERFSLLSRTCADIASQLSAVQIEVKSMGCESSTADAGKGKHVAGATATTDSVAHHRLSRRHGYSRRSEDRLKNLERKVAVLAQRRLAQLDTKRVAYEKGEWLTSNLSKRVKSLEKNQVELSRRVSSANENAISTKQIGESVGSRLVGSLRALEEIVETNNSAIKGELARLGVNAAQKAAELSLTRVELSNLRRAVQALSVSASKLQEKSDRQQEAIDRLNGSRFAESRSSPNHLELELEQLEDRYHLIVDKLPDSCEERSADRSTGVDGLRLVEAGRGRKPIMVYCRNGWVVVARRIDGTFDFDRSWNDYSLGFGSPVGEYWIGNQILHEFTQDNCTRLRIDMLDIYGERWRAEYDSFAITSAETGYRLLVDGYVGNATDAMSYQNGMPFSAKDRDMDDSTAHCAANYHGGWWFNRCQHANLNGKYSLGLAWYRSDTDQWMSIAASEMSMRRNPDCPRSR
ncbi:protein scabrous [Megalopta genalis]|uniref:protein scabrous n=1 Tax=Megalopta genalis TaxID=115081 RepID=UPI001442FC0A|nr:protein scabrous-like [Megalopta genalis]